MLLLPLLITLLQYLIVGNACILPSIQPCPKAKPPPCQLHTFICLKPQTYKVCVAHEGRVGWVINDCEGHETCDVNLSFPCRDASLQTYATTEIPRCNGPGLHPSRNRCNEYFECINFRYWWRPSPRKCPQGQAFNPETKTCVGSTSCSGSGIGTEVNNQGSEESELNIKEESRHEQSQSNVLKRDRKRKHYSTVEEENLAHHSSQANQSSRSTYKKRITTNTATSRGSPDVSINIANSVVPSPIHQNSHQNGGPLIKPPRRHGGSNKDSDSEESSESWSNES